MRRVALLLILTACGSPVGPRYGIPNAVPVSSPQPAQIMDSMWRDVQHCSGITTTDSWTRITWFTIAADSFPYDGYHTAIGLWISKHRIYLATGQVTKAQAGRNAAYYLGIYQSTIEHEMLHDLTQSGVHGSAFVACQMIPADP